MKILSWVRSLCAEFTFFVSVYVLGIFFVLTFGFLESVGLNLELVGTFFVVVLFREYLWRHMIRKKHIRGWRHILIEFVLFFIILQIFLALVVPLSSVIPQKMLLSTGLIYTADSSACDVNRGLEETKALYGSSVAYEKIQVVAGGFNRSLWLLEKQKIIPYGSARVAMTFGSTMYVYDFVECPTEDVYFHEMTHVWQMQKTPGVLFGITTIPTWVQFAHLQITNPRMLYDYDGEMGLFRARQEKRQFSDFGMEQQARIIEDWYLMGVGNKNSYGEYFTPEYRQLLEYYVREVQGVLGA